MDGVSIESPWKTERVVISNWGISKENGLKCMGEDPCGKLYLRHQVPIQVSEHLNKAEEKKRNFYSTMVKGNMFVNK